MGLLSRFGYVKSSEVAALRDSVARLETKVALTRKKNASGVEIMSGSYQYEDLDAMSGTARWITLNKMRGDAHVDGAIRDAMYPLITGTWEVQPASDKPIDQEKAEFVAANLLRTSGDKYGSDYWCQSSWAGQRLPEICDMVPSGFAMFAKSTREVGGKVVYDRLQWLEPDSVDPHGWTLDDSDNIVSVRRTFMGPTGEYKIWEPLQAAQIALYVWNLKGARFEGRSFLRPMYGAWFRKDWLLRMAMIWAQKVGAPVPFGSYPETWDPAIIAKFNSFVEQLRGTSPAEAFGSFPKDVDGNEASVKFAGAEAGELDRMRGLINGENAEIAHAGSTKGQLMGETASGAKAVAEPISKKEQQLSETLAVIVAEQENSGVGNLRGLVQELVDWNFAGTKQYPRLICSKMNPFQSVGLVAALAQASAAGLVPKHEEVQRQVAGWFGLKLTDAAFEVPEPPPLPLGPLPPKIGPDGKPLPPDPKEGQPGDEEGAPAKKATPPFPPKKDVAKETAEASLAISESTLAAIQRRWNTPDPGATPATAKGRPPNLIESRVVSLAAVNEAFRTGERDIFQGLSDAKWIALEEIMSRVKAGKFSRRNLKTQLQSRFRGANRALAPVEKALLATGAKGVAHAKAEIARLKHVKAEED